MARAQIVIPCFNEEDRLNLGAFKDFTGEPHDIKFLFVNDGSKDRTAELINDLSSSDPSRFSAIHLSKNGGKAEAVRQGIIAAGKARQDYLGFWDADLATPLATISDFIDLAEGRPQLQIVMGSRVKLLGRKIDRRASRHYIGRFFATAVSLTLGLDVYDTQCGAKLFRSSSLILGLFREPFLSRWIFDVEILARLIQSRRGTDLPQAKDIICEFPLMEWRDVPGSKLCYRDFLLAGRELTRIYNHYF